MAEFPKPRKGPAVSGGVLPLKPAQATDATEAPSGKKRGSFAGALVFLIALGIIKPWEGLSLRTYYDIVNIATVCYGQTGDAAKPGAVYSQAQCEHMLGEEVTTYAKALDECVDEDVELTARQQAVLLSWSYNVGTGAACRSTLVRMINQGKPYTEWCPQLLRWNRAGGQVVKGLTNRRQAEYAECMRGPE